MAYFHCLIGGGSGGGYELTVTCDADFAGTTITCTDGVTTLTKNCPSSSPYEVVFEIPNGGDWTISGVVAGHTVSTGVNIPTSAELIATIQQTITIHSAKEDTISYTDIDGATQTITFASGETSKQVQITINPSGSSITFTSSIAKNPNNLSQDYSKTFTITTSTTDIYLMPDAVKTLYWWGYENGIEDVSTANGWTDSNYAFHIPTHNTTNIYCTTSAGYNAMYVGNQNAISGNTVKAIINGQGFKCTSSSKVLTNTETVIDQTSGLATYDIDITSKSYFAIGTVTTRQPLTINALWYE